MPSSEQKPLDEFTGLVDSLDAKRKALVQSIHFIMNLLRVDAKEAMDRMGIFPDYQAAITALL